MTPSHQKAEEKIIEKFRDKFLNVSRLPFNVSPQESVEKFLRNALHQYRAEVLEEALEALPESVEEGFAIEGGIKITDIPLEMLKDMDSFRRGMNVCLEECKKSLNNLKSK